MSTTDTTPQISDEAMDQGMSLLEELMTKLSGVAFGTLLAMGIIMFIIGTILLVKNRRAIKILYFYSGLKFFTMLSFMIGLFILSKKEVETSTPFFILGGSSLAVGLVGAVISACFGRFGIIVLGLQAGWSIWSIFSVFIKNQIVNLSVGLVVAVIFAIICGVFKRPMEILIASFTGANNFSFGLLYIIVSILGFAGSPALAFEKAFPYGSIAALVLTLILFIVSMWYHYSAFVDARRAEHQPLMAEV
ncbi:hypothetical protein K502DRAFT_22553 [Neoconidiobolus thromboides FSU 785]|nr:hypothetical protein K502DRAFT_22553 [Neoconidiobolus thromboides FSU 785]